MYPTWTMLHPKMRPEMLGPFLPFFLVESDPRGAAEQINERYRFGGWNSFKGFTRVGEASLQYPGDPLMEPIAMCQLREEKIYLYRGDWIMVLQPSGEFDVARID